MENGKDRLVESLKFDERANEDGYFAAQARGPLGAFLDRCFSKSGTGK